MAVVGGIGLGACSILAYLAPLDNTLLEGRDIQYFGGGGSAWVLSGVFICI